jgi:hypothetical protein
MKFIYFITFLILFSYIYSFSSGDCSAANAQSHYIDTSSKYYKSEITFDWTSEDSYDLNIPFVRLSSLGDISPFLANATFIKFAKKIFNGVYVDNNIVEVEDFDRFYNLDANKTGTFQGYTFAKELPEGDNTLLNNVLRTSVKSTFLKANENKVGEAYKYYFGWFECGGDKKQRFRVSEIMISINNGKLYQISKYLLFVMAALLF